MRLPASASLGGACLSASLNSKERLRDATRVMLCWQRHSWHIVSEESYVIQAVNKAFLHFSFPAYANKNNNNNCVLKGGARFVHTTSTASKNYGRKHKDFSATQVQFTATARCEVATKTLCTDKTLTEHQKLRIGRQQKHSKHQGERRPLQKNAVNSDVSHTHFPQSQNVPAFIAGQSLREKYYASRRMNNLPLSLFPNDDGSLKKSILEETLAVERRPARRARILNVLKRLDKENGAARSKSNILEHVETEPLWETDDVSNERRHEKQQELGEVPSRNSCNAKKRRLAPTPTAAVCLLNPEPKPHITPKMISSNPRQLDVVILSSKSETLCPDERTAETVKKATPIFPAHNVATTSFQTSGCTEKIHKTHLDTATTSSETSPTQFFETFLSTVDTAVLPFSASERQPLTSSAFHAQPENDSTDTATPTELICIPPGVSERKRQQGNNWTRVL